MASLADTSSRDGIADDGRDPLTGLADLADQPARVLSIGEQQRLGKRPDSLRFSELIWYGCIPLSLEFMRVRSWK